MIFCLLDAQLLPKRLESTAPVPSGHLHLPFMPLCGILYGFLVSWKLNTQLHAGLTWCHQCDSVYLGANDASIHHFISYLAYIKNHTQLWGTFRYFIIWLSFF